MSLAAGSYVVVLYTLVPMIITKVAHRLELKAGTLSDMMSSGTLKCLTQLLRNASRRRRQMHLLLGSP